MRGNTIGVLKSFIRRFVQIVRKSAKCPLSPEGIVQFTAENATQSEKIAAVKIGASLKRPVFFSS